MYMRKLTHPEIVAQQKKTARRKRLPFVVVLNNIRSLFNVGSIFRTADGAGVEKVWLCGYTGYPPSAQISKTALGAEERVPWDYVADAAAVIKAHKSKGYMIVFLEQMDESCEYHKFKPKGPVCLVIGNEIEGISAELVPFCDKAVDIAMDGIKNSLNVSVAFGVVAYHIRHCLRQVGRSA